MFKIIKKLEDRKGKEVNRPGFRSYLGGNEETDATCYGKTIKTPYGETIKSVYADDLKEALKDFESVDWKNNAFIAFLNELPDDLKIWLYWN